MNRYQRTALDHPCLLGTECVHPRYRHVRPGRLCTVVLTVNTGYECIDNGFGGPVWHVSIAPRFLTMPRSALFEIATNELCGVGDAALGEWREIGEIAVHLRRRLTPREMEAGRIAGVCDIRGTPEHARRIEAMRPYLPAPMSVWSDYA